MNGENIEEKGLANHRKNHISLVFQNYNLIDYLTPVENVKLGGNADAEMLLTQMGIDKSTRKRNVMQLSGGQQQRVAIARALASKAPVLLADEPTGNLDEDTAKDIVEIFKSLAHEQDKCVIVVTHSKELAAEADVILTSQTDKKSDLRPFYLFVIYKNKKYFSVLTYAHSFNSSCSKYPLASDLQYKYQNPKQKLQPFPLWRWQ